MGELNDLIQSGEQNGKFLIMRKVKHAVPDAINTLLDDESGNVILEVHRVVSDALHKIEIDEGME